MIHFVFESLAYSAGFWWYLRERRRSGDVINTHARWWVVAAAIGGAAIGSRLLFLLEDPAETAAHWRDVTFLLSGKTVVGAFAGGLVAVELVKRLIGVREPTGDLFAVPLALGIAIGRIGCFLSGLNDHTYGLATTLPWGVDFGDGVRRHPTQLYESLFALLLAVALSALARRPHRQGDVFKMFLGSYMAFRLVIDGLKPGVALAFGLTAIQWTALAVIVFYACYFIKRMR